MILERFRFGHKEGTMKNWIAYSEKVERLKNEKKHIKIGIVGKYFDIGDYVLEDSYVSVIEAIKHASYANDIYPEICWIDSKTYEEGEHLQELKQYDGIIVPGGFGTKGIEGKINAIAYARKHKIPFLGLCYGLQLAVVEFARNMCGLEKANTTEADKETEDPVIDILPEQKRTPQKKKIWCKHASWKLCCCA
jgi:CTP synthase